MPGLRAGDLLAGCGANVRHRWADVGASDGEDEDEIDALPPTLAALADDSYREAPLNSLEDSCSGVNLMLRQAASLLPEEEAREEAREAGHKDFGFLLSGQTGSDTPTTQASETATPQMGPAASSQLNADAPEFVPTLTMACPVVGFCCLDTVEEVPSRKRTKSEERDEPDRKTVQMSMPDASEEEWLHRIDRRCKTIAAGKKTSEYQRYRDLKRHDDREEGEPLTPDPMDRTVSKRRWKYQVEQWRTLLSKFYGDEGHGSVASTEEWPSNFTTTTEEPEGTATTFDGEDDKDGRGAVVASEDGDDASSV